MKRDCVVDYGSNVNYVVSDPPHLWVAYGFVQ